MLSYTLSHWEAESFFDPVDCVVLGAGITGLSAAIAMKERAPAMQILVLDRGPLPIGASTRNAGFACFGSLSELIDDLHHSSKDEVLALVEKRYQGLQLLRQRFGETAIGYEHHGGYEIFDAKEEALYEECLQHKDSFNEELRSITGMDQTFVAAHQKLPASGLRHFSHAIHNQAEGQLDTGRLMRSLLTKAQQMGIWLMGGITITKLEEHLEKVSLLTDLGWELQTPRLVVATNGFAKTLLPNLDVQPARNQVLITTPIDDLRISGCFHYNRGYVYFRNVGKRLLLGGARHLDMAGETTDGFGANQQIRAYLEGFLKTELLPEQNPTIERWWAGIMGVGPQKRPIVEALGPRVVVAARLGGMGVALGTWVGESAAALVTA